MYADFAQAMVTNMTTRMDPMNKVIGTLMEGQAKEQTITLSKLQREEIKEINTALDKARESQPLNVSVIDAYERLLAKVTAL